MIYIHIYIRQCEYDVGAGDRLRVVACRRRCSPSPLPPRSRTRSAQPGRPPSTRQGRRPPPNRHSPPRPPRQRRRGRGQLVRCRGGQLVPCRGFGWWRCLRGQRQRSRRPPWRRLEAASSSTRGSGGVVPNGPMAQWPNGPMAQWPNGPAPPADESVEPPRAARGALGRRRSRARALPRAGSGHAPMRATPSVWLRRVATWHIYIHTWSPPGTEGRSHLQAISRQSPGDLRGAQVYL